MVGIGIDIKRYIIILSIHCMSERWHPRVLRIVCKEFKNLYDGVPKERFLATLRCWPKMCYKIMSYYLVCILYKKPTEKSNDRWLRIHICLNRGVESIFSGVDLGRSRLNGFWLQFVPRKRYLRLSKHHFGERDIDINMHYDGFGASGELYRLVEKWLQSIGIVLRGQNFVDSSKNLAWKINFEEMRIMFEHAFNINQKLETPGIIVEMDGESKLYHELPIFGYINVPKSISMSMHHCMHGLLKDDMTSTSLVDSYDVVTEKLLSCMYSNADTVMSMFESNMLNTSIMY